MKLDRLNISLVGFLQAIAVAFYCFLVASFFNYMERFSDKPDPPHFLGGALILLLLVFSVALCGILVFAYPAYLFVNKKIKRALYILAYTFLYAVLIFFVVLFGFVM